MVANDKGIYPDPSRIAQGQLPRALAPFVGIIPHMSQSAEILERIQRRLSAVDKTERAASLEAGLSESTIRDTRRNETVPRFATLKRLAPVLRTTAQWLMTGEGPEEIGDDPGVKTAPPLTSEVRPADIRIPDPHDLPRDLPVYGTVAASIIGGKETFEITPIVDHVRRPPGLAGVRDAYALYVSGDSMFPMYKPGDLVMVHPFRPPAIHDTVIVQLRGDPPQGFIKILIGREPEYLVLQQLNPAATIKCKHEAIKAVHKVMTLAELMAW